MIRVKKKKKLLCVSPNANYIFRKIQGQLYADIAWFAYNAQVDAQTDFLQGNNDIKTLAEDVRKVLSDKRYDLILTLGKSSTQVVQHSTRRQRINTPIAFGGVFNPAGDGMVISERYSGNNLTGIATTARGYEQQVNELYRFMSDVVKRIVIIP